jgi:hypothetical protein
MMDQLRKTRQRVRNLRSRQRQLNSAAALDRPARQFAARVRSSGRTHPIHTFWQQGVGPAPFVVNCTPEIANRLLSLAQRLCPDVVPEIRAASTRSNRLEISITPSHVAWRRGSRSGRLWTPSIGLSGPHGIWREPRREPRASHVGSVMPDEPLLREKAREAIRAAKLPSRRPDGTLGGLGFGGACALCGELLRRNQMELAAEFESPDATSRLRDSYHFHPRCYLVWEFERTQGGTVSSPPPS